MPIINRFLGLTNKELKHHFPMCCKLNAANIVTFIPEAKDIEQQELEVMESCDYYYSITLAPIELRQLAVELQMIADIVEKENR